MYKSNKHGNKLYSLKEKKYVIVETWYTYDENGKLLEKKEVHTQKNLNAEKLLYTTVIKKYHRGGKTVEISHTFENLDGGLFTTDPLTLELGRFHRVLINK